ncbi:hypothetical protein OTU49_013713, partial [Cherax quadricarinatus]
STSARALIDAGANLDAQDNALRTPLHVSVLGEATEVMKLLLEAGCNYNALNNTSFTAMHVAALSGNEKAIQELCAAGLSPEERDELGLLPEEVAEAWGKHNTAWLLRKMPKSKDNSGPKPIRQMLRRSWEEYESEGEKTLSWVHQETLVFIKENIPENRDGHYQNPEGLTALHVAAKLGHTAIARVLMDSCGALPGVLTY